MLTKGQVLAALTNIDQVPARGRKCGVRERTIYEIAGPPGHFCIDYASFPGGTSEEVDPKVIAEMERDGLIHRAFPDSPGVNAWKLK